MSGGQDRGIQFPDAPKLQLDELLDELVDRARDVQRAQGRLRSLLRAIGAITGDLSLEQVLHRVVDAARVLAEAEYAALGVIGADHGLDQFIHSGMPASEAALIGELPAGKGLLGALITDPHPIRLRHLGQDPRSTGFPDHHPPMDSFLGVPIHTGDQIFGNLYLTNSRHGEFSSDDEELVVALAGAAGTAIRNAQLYQAARRQQRWLQASAEIQTLLIGAGPDAPLDGIAQRAFDIADADLVTLSLLTETRDAFVIESAIGTGADELAGRPYDVHDSLSGRVVETGRPLLVGDSETFEFVPLSQRLGVLEVGPLIMLPLRGTHETHGVLALVRSRGRAAFTDTDMTMAAGFAAQASIALELAQAHAVEQQMIVVQDRERIARDLHDHVIQQLFAIGLDLEMAVRSLPADDPLAERLGARAGDLDTAMSQIRTSIFALQQNLSEPRQGLRQSILTVVASVAPLLGYSPTVSFSGLLDISLSAELTDDVIATVRELLTNIVKHAAATSASLEVELVDDLLTVTVSDNGRGFSGQRRRSGLANLRARAERHRGTLEITTADDGRTLLLWTAHTT